MKNRDILRRFFVGFFNFLFPDGCRCCGVSFVAHSGDGGNLKFLCNDCLKGAVQIDLEQCCKNCGYPIQHDDVLDKLFKKSHNCPSCEDEKRFFDIARSVYQYNGTIRKIILRLKYCFNTECINFICNGLLDCYSKMSKADVICFVPITNKKLFFTGFNHAGTIANGFFSALRQRDQNIKEVYIRDLLVKTKKTIQSKKLSREGRMVKIHNIEIKEKYRTKEKISDFKGKTFLIIDDIMTTGGTMNAVAKLLKDTFPSCKVECLTFARTMLY